MTMDGVFADEKALGDGVIAEADGNEPQHLELAHSQAAPILAACGLRLAQRWRR